MKEIKIVFNAQGWVKQTIEITDPTVTPEALVEMLNEGKAVTTIQEDGLVEILATGKQIGRVINVDNNLEYEEFDIES